MSILERIIASVEAAEQQARERISLRELLTQAERRAGAGLGAGRRSLRAALEPADSVRIIAEVKRASPSKGVIRDPLDAPALARRFEAGGAAAISVLTEPEFFRGGPDDLVAARGAVGLPVLRKDFIMSEYAVAASAAMGADAVLLIVRLLEPGLLRGLYQQAENLGLECLVEIHDEADLARLEGIEPAIVGINNRDLATFETNLATAGRLAGELPAATIPVALSGIAEAADVRAAAEAGITRFLVGESLVRAPDAAVLLRSLRKALDRG